MKKMGKTAIALLVAMLVMGWCAPCFAESEIKEVFQDGLYGGLTGVLVGAAMLAFTHKPGNHLDYMGYGGAAGVMLGVTYGVVKSTRALAEVENGKVRFALPTIMPDIKDPNSRGETAVIVMAEVVRGRF